MGLKLADRVAFRNTDYGGVLIDIRGRSRRWLNKSGADIIRLCDGTRSPEQVARACVDSWATDDENLALADVSELIQQMQKLGLVVDQPDAGIGATAPSGAQLDTAQVHVSLRCNLRCTHCYNNSGAGLTDELRLDEFYRFFDEISAMGAYEVTITGGEPFFHPDIWPILEHATSHFLVTLMTNGLLVDEETCRRLKEIGIYEIYVSLDGASAATNDLVRGHGTFDRAVAAIRRMKASDLPVFLNTAVNRHNLSELDAMVELAKSLGIKRYAMQEVIREGRASAGDLSLSSSEVIAFKQWFFQKRMTEKEILIGEVDKQAAPAALGGSSAKQPRNLCPAIRSSLTLMPNGDIVPCTLMVRPELVTGNIRRQSVSEIWNCAPIHATLRSINNADCAVCATCKIKDLCGGGCRALAYFESGSFTGPPASEECRWRKQLFIRAASEAGLDLDQLVAVVDSVRGDTP